MSLACVRHSNLRMSIRPCLNFQNNSNTSKLQQGQQVSLRVFPDFLILNRSCAPQFIFLFWNVAGSTGGRSKQSFSDKWKGSRLPNKTPWSRKIWRPRWRVFCRWGRLLIGRLVSMLRVWSSQDGKPVWLSSWTFKGKNKGESQIAHGLETLTNNSINWNYLQLILSFLFLFVFWDAIYLYALNILLNNFWNTTY